MFAPAKKLVVHHTAHPQRLCYGRRSHRRSPGDHYYHAVTQRYGDIGYTALIDKFGNVYEGRHGRGEGTAREILSAGVVAGHDYAHNYGSAGVALLGDATQPGWAMTGGPEDPTWHALVSFGVFEAGRHFIRPLKTDDATATASDFLRSDNVWTNNMHNVSGHRETNSTACPGEAVMTLLDELQSEVHGALSDTSRTGVLLSTAPGGREARVNTPITYEWAAEQPEGDWTLDGYEYCLEGWYKLSNSNDITYLKGYTTGTTQPRPLYTPVSKETTSLKFTPTKAGQYTFHVQVVFKRTGVDGTEVRRRSAYEGRHTFLVK